MSRRKEFKDLAAGIAGMFASRNNDIDGYWALGMLYKSASEASINRITLDLLSRDSTPGLQPALVLASRYKKYLLSQLKNRGFKRSQLTQAAHISLDSTLSPLKGNNRKN